VVEHRDAYASDNNDFDTLVAETVDQYRDEE